MKSETLNYQSYKWKKKSKRILKMDRELDRVAAMFGRHETAEMVHHIYPAKEYPQYAWEDWNLISVSRKTHNKLENRNTGELTQLGIWLMSQTEPGKNWRNRHENKYATK